MNQQELVETVLREVKRALAERGLTIGSAPATKPAASAVSPGPVPKAADSGGSDLTGKLVITLKDIQAVRGGTVNVARTAVITPMAVDYTREKGINIVRIETARRREAESAVSGAATVGLAVCSDFSGGGATVRSVLEAKGFAVREFTGPTYEAAVAGMCAAVASGAAAFGVCLEQTGMQGPIHANRNRTIRAVHCRDTFEARAARVDIGANVVALDSRSDPVGVISGFTGIEGAPR